jgi:hypothetical protein
MKITKEQLYQMENAARRKVSIEEETPRVKYVIHKSKKQYNRQKNKKISY